MPTCTLLINLTAAPAFIAALVREGVAFKAQQDGGVIAITFTGGF